MLDCDAQLLLGDQISRKQHFAKCGGASGRRPATRGLDRSERRRRRDEMNRHGLRSKNETSNLEVNE
jgi:hypothetical protein